MKGVTVFGISFFLYDQVEIISVQHVYVVCVKIENRDNSYVPFHVMIVKIRSISSHFREIFRRSIFPQRSSRLFSIQRSIIKPYHFKISSAVPVIFTTFEKQRKRANSGLMKRFFNRPVKVVKVNYC